MVLKPDQQEKFKILLRVYDQYFNREFAKAQLSGEEFQMEYLKREHADLHMLLCELASIYIDCNPEEDLEREV